MSDYEVFSCSYYDILTLLAMRKTRIDMKTSSGEEKDVVIEDLTTKDGEEFAHLSNGTKYRLDHLMSARELNSGVLHQFQG